ncbi:L-lysine 6-transaminase [Pseudonocardia abyssalis]|uniref:L-lysine 6-transaminase n=1 Tax=Pseudonocardia abyssalis TaxID=2792008 RepID=A0ABS6UU66_9PSEU|nr:L-lysine 6-transaminase [Pseudonocardia abyssalis]MBW0117260.1 L-lysine 6-transaminase [Pseudonocardia abyssalis]MBW0135418.1 L-lysine 6-transaminase [Pseudonocardia abyssalis]
MTPDDVHETLRRHLLVDGFDLVLDTRASRGSWIVDARDGTRYLDLFSFFASAPLGLNHPALADDPVFLAELTDAAVNKPSNSDVYTVAMARFVETFARVVGDPALPHLFFVEGGAAAVENALKTAFDWKRRHNAAHGRPAHLGTKVLHLTRAFHGRSGYTMSLTTTDPVKTALFPTFDWPRIDVPAAHFPGDVRLAEAGALEQARAAFAAHPHDIACFVAEPIQGEGGDNHLRSGFLRAMQALCVEHDALLVLDEVQTGGGMTGTAWAYQQLGVSPDVVAFGKKLQVCGVMAGGRVDEVPDNVFAVSSRINSTWGGNLTDMVRSRRHLEVIEADGLIPRAAVLGEYLLAALAGVPGLSSVRGRGLFCAADLPTPAARDAVLHHLLHGEHVLMLGSGERSVRFRPALTITAEELDLAVAALTRAVAATTGPAVAA